MLDDEQIGTHMTAKAFMEGAEYVCWLVLFLTPLLYLINGPSVSLDQSITRWVLSGGAMAIAIVIRIICMVSPKGTPSSQPSFTSATVPSIRSET